MTKLVEKAKSKQARRHVSARGICVARAVSKSHLEKPRAPRDIHSDALDDARARRIFVLFTSDASVRLSKLYQNRYRIDVVFSSARRERQKEKERAETFYFRTSVLVHSSRVSRSPQINVAALITNHAPRDPSPTSAKSASRRQSAQSFLPLLSLFLFLSLVFLFQFSSSARANDITITADLKCQS